ncbi:MAG: HesB/IscA family protein [Nitrososphaerales archaeon]
MLLSITDNAAMHAKELLQKAGSMDGILRLRIIAGGCAGLQYKLDVADPTPRDNDMVVDNNGVKLLVDQKSAMFVTGSTLDFIDTMIPFQGGFKLLNPKLKSQCSCGHSFALK